MWTKPNGLAVQVDVKVISLCNLLVKRMRSGSRPGRVVLKLRAFQDVAGPSRVRQILSGTDGRESMSKTRYGMLAGIAGAAFAGWWWRHRRSSEHINDERGEVIFTNSPRASEIG